MFIYLKQFESFFYRNVNIIFSTTRIFEWKEMHRFHSLQHFSDDFAFFFFIFFLTRRIYANKETNKKERRKHTIIQEKCLFLDLWQWIDNKQLFLLTRRIQHLKCSRIERYTRGVYTCVGYLFSSMLYCIFKKRVKM